MDHQKTNRLINETSPYLLQHAHNPVNWYPWGEEAFQKARTENKPVLLSIGYSACHWCHVMERESFENENIATLMNELFVNIKVDREERPDLDEIYMNAVQMLTGRGGWPMTVFLTPEGEPFYGGTYFPPEDRHGMVGFPKILAGVARAYRDKREDVKRSVSDILAALRRMSQTQASERSLTRDIIAASAAQISRAHDHDHGGIGQAPKFPHPGVYELFLRHYHHSRNEQYLEMVTQTLTEMARGGIYDHLGGGFHRYSVDAKWLVPHFEKMIYDNAQLVRIYAQAYLLTRNSLFKNVVEESLGYLLREMLHGEGGFYSTQDADSEGEEGKFFVWEPGEITRLLGDEAGEIFARIYDVSEEGNFEGKNILHVSLTTEQASKYFNKSEAEIDTLVREAKKALFQAREQRIKPFRDEKIIVSWNGLMLSGLAEAIKIIPQTRYLEAAQHTVELIFGEMFEDGKLLHTYKDGKGKILGYLDDYAFLAIGLLDLYETTFERSLLRRAVQLVNIMLEEFWDESKGAFYYTGRSHEKLISRVKPVFDSSIPSGNAMAVQSLLRLYYLTGREEYLNRAEKALQCYYDAMEAQPFGFAHMLCAFDFYLRKPREIVLVGTPESPDMQNFIREIQSLYLPNKTIHLASPGEPMAEKSPLLEGKTQIDGQATAYVCHNRTCSAPVTDWRALIPLLES